MYLFRRAWEPLPNMDTRRPESLTYYVLFRSCTCKLYAYVACRLADRLLSCALAMLFVLLYLPSPAVNTAPPAFSAAGLCVCV